jgi:pimeloyl-ACP methyl ester carboxylesterase
VERTSSSDGTEIAYRVAGEGEPVVLVHGAATSSADWAFLVPHLRERFTVVSMDRRGRGRSGDGAQYAIEREAEDVLAVLEAVGAELLVGHSYGALCSILAAQRTDRLRRLVLYEPPIGIRPARLAGLEERVAEGDAAEALAGFLAGAGVLEPHVELIRESPAWPVLLNAVPSLPRELRAAAEWKHPAGPIDVPTLFLRGGDTTGVAYLDGFEDLRAAFEDSRLELLPGQTHIAHVLAAEAFARALTEFLGA